MPHKRSHKLAASTCTDADRIYIVELRAARRVPKEGT
jgi:hypothetical protein